MCRQDAFRQCHKAQLSLRSRSVPVFTGRMEMMNRGLQVVKPSHPLIEWPRFREYSKSQEEPESDLREHGPQKTQAVGLESDH